MDLFLHRLWDDTEIIGPLITDHTVTREGTEDIFCG